MTDSQFPSDDLLARVLSGEATAEETAGVEAWAEAPENRRELELLKSAFEKRSPEAAWDVERAWARVAGKAFTQDSAPTVIPIAAARGWRSTALRLAAAVVLVVGVLFAWRLVGGTSATVYASGPGELLNVALSDGSEAVLAPNTILTVPGDYGDFNRSVSLDGEAWFSVEHDPRSVFSVATDGYLVTDLGTVFSVTARSPNAAVVAVVEGAVMVQHVDGATEDRSLIAGELGRFAASSQGEMPINEVEVAQPVTALTSWHTGTLDLEDATVSSVLTRLGDWFGIPVSIADTALSARLITGSIPLAEFDDAIDVLELLLGVDAVGDSSGVELR